MDGLNSKIEKKAYDYFLARGMTHGGDIEDWLKAEKEILEENKCNKKSEKKLKKVAGTIVTRIIKMKQREKETELPKCTKAPEWAEHQRFSDNDEACDDGRSGGIQK